MGYLTAAVVVVGLLCLLDLVLTLGVIRRLREHTDLLDRSMAGMSPPVGVPVGETVAEFAATTIEGEPVSRELLAGRTLVGFFSPGCQPCEEQMPGFIEYARSNPGGTPHVLAVVAAVATDDVATDKEYVQRLAPVARVVVEEPAGPVQAAFQVTGYPAIYLVDDGGVVAAAGWAMNALDGATASPPAGQVASL